MCFPAPLRPPALVFAQEVPFDFLMFTRFLSRAAFRASRRWVLRLGFFMAATCLNRQIQPLRLGAAVVVLALA